MRDCFGFIRFALQIDFSATRRHKNDFVASPRAQAAYNAAGRILAAVRRALLGDRYAQFA